MNGDDIEEAVLGHAARNAELLRNLESRGVDLQATRSVEHHFWSKTQHDAALLANELYKRGYLVLVLAPAARRETSKYTWNVEAGIQASPERAGSDAVVRDLAGLAASFNSRYDGWGTTI